MDNEELKRMIEKSRRGARIAMIWAYMSIALGVICLVMMLAKSYLQRMYPDSWLWREVIRVDPGTRKE